VVEAAVALAAAVVEADTAVEAADTVEVEADTAGAAVVTVVVADAAVVAAVATVATVETGAAMTIRSAVPWAMHNPVRAKLRSASSSKFNVRPAG
jgi:hypothetical protein